MSSVSYFVTGASRGLGLEFVTQLLARPNTKVVATARDPTALPELAALQRCTPSDRLLVLQYDVTDFRFSERVVEESSKFLENKLDVLIANAGTVFQRGVGFQERNWDKAIETLTVNAVASFVLLQALLPLMKNAQRRTVLFISSRQASFELTQHSPKSVVPLDSWYPDYNVSKAALNMAILKFGQELKDDGFILVPMSPGWVRTRGGGDDAPLTLHESIRGMLEYLDRVTLNDTTKFVDYQGNAMPW
ncbi:NADP-binding protein [Dacryopinax primogenitus]|uniref:NADP-binding protein n=1 Tax=Dacryopinax primogenitus (strain DJM 731) TaxID=1858805 RepID=M5G900_DACPD|nr:NADP-binding protein [Dacryopinax primogenitus]EJU05184.1 NADP-binding protein [Dacryopinax primogenitus]